MLPAQVRRWRGVAAWSWNAGDAGDVCGICRIPFDGCAPDSRFPGDDSPVVWGQCGHAYHLQCITKWVSSKPEQRCPICRQNWEFKFAADLRTPDRERLQAARMRRL